MPPFVIDPVHGNLQRVGMENCHSSAVVVQIANRTVYLCIPESTTPMPTFVRLPSPRPLFHWHVLVFVVMVTVVVVVRKTHLSTAPQDLL